MEYSLKTLEDVARIASNFSSPKKALIITCIHDGYSTREITEACELTRQGLQRHIDTLLLTGIITRNPTGKHGGFYALTPYGELVYNALQELQNVCEKYKSVETDVKLKEYLEEIKILKAEGKLPEKTRKELEKLLKD